MSQTSYEIAPAAGQAGLLADSSFMDKKTLVAQEQISPGLGVVKVVGKDNRCRLPVANIVTITNSGGTWTAGNCTITVNGITQTVTYDTDKATMMAKVATAFQNTQAVATAVYNGSAHTIVITAVDNETIACSMDITGITGTMTISSTLSSSGDTAHGISVLSGAMAQHGGGQVQVLDKAVITFAGDALTTSDTIIVTINGVTLATITYATSEAATLQALASLIEAVNGVASATVASRTITILNNPGLPLLINSVAVDDDTVASVQVTASVAHSSQSASIGAVWYAATDPVPVLRRGRIYVTVEQAVTSDDLVYVRIIASGTYVRGGFRKDADTDKAARWTAANYVTSAAAGGVAVVEINLP
jgi:hypothetical protein